MNPALHLAIAAKMKKQREEEESMAQYSAEDLNGWEFKIVRSNFGRFRNEEVVRRLISEEAQNGWEMVEKFDDYRIRFKRRTDKRALHSGGGTDPYRTTYGTSNAVMPLMAIAVALVLAGAMLLFSAKDHGDGTIMPWIILGAIVVLGAVAVVIKRR